MVAEAQHIEHEHDDEHDSPTKIQSCRDLFRRIRRVLVLREIQQLDQLELDVPDPADADQKLEGLSDSLAVDV